MAAARLLFFTSLALACACGGAKVPGPTYSPQPTSALVPIPSEPPPARAERVPARPQGAIAWIDGEWTWRRRRWSWTPGRWVAPAAGTTYSPWCTVRAPDGSLYYAPAVWRDAKGAVVDPPRALASAAVEAGMVVDPEGNAERTVVGAPK
jgi:hypothetical protein